MLQQMTKEFMQHFFSVYDNNIATPYMHIFVANIHEFKKIHSIINAFNCQGLEKLNDLTTSQFFRATNKKTIKTNESIPLDDRIWLRQILELRSRMDTQILKS